MAFYLKNKMTREQQKKIVREFKERWGKDFPLRSKYIEDFKIPHHMIAPELTREEFKKLWNELVEEIEKEDKKIQSKE